MMDVDRDPPTSSGVKRPSLPSRTSSESSAKRAKLDLPDYLLAKVNDQMNKTSKALHWPQLFEDALGDHDITSMLWSAVVTTLTEALSTTDAKAAACAALNGAQAKSLIHGFNREELKEWEAGFRKGVDKHDWTDLIMHSKLWEPTAKHHRPYVRETIEEQAERLYDKFHQAYQGGAHEDFMKGLQIYDSIYNERIHFGRVIPIVQSSGTGKSRLVDMIGNMVPALSICFREYAHPAYGWPPDDEPARTFFLRDRDVKYRGEELAAAFLGALMHVLAEQITLLEPTGLLPKHLMQKWELQDPTNIMESSRFKCFLEVTVKAEALLSENKDAIERTRTPSRFLGIPDTVAPAEWHKKVFDLLCRSYFRRLSDLLNARNIKYLVIAFDECTLLNKAPVSTDSTPPSWKPQWHMELVALQRIIKAYDSRKLPDVTFWFLFLDTSLSIPDLIQWGKSARLTSGYQTLPPWPYMGFNQMVPKDVIAQIKLPTDVLTLQHLKLHGRPYWSTLSQEEVMHAAYEKLFSGSFLPSNVNHVLAAFANRVGLEIGEGEAATRLSIDAVGSHMRILMGVVGHLVITTSPSEPILAIAAAQALNVDRVIYEAAMVTLLDKLILQGLVIDRGVMGELGSRLMLLRARDQATTAGGNTFVDVEDEVISVRAVQLSKFLQTLLGKDLGVSLPEQSKLRDQLLQDTSDVWINFTHFVHLSISIDEVTPALLFQAWSSGFAVQCVFHQAVMDGFIVGYFGRLDQPFNISNLFVIPYQTKARSDAADSAVARALAAPFLSTQGNNVRQKPWTVVILMDLVTTSAFRKANGPRCDLTYAPAERPQGKKKGGSWKGYAQKLEVEPNRYCLNVRGHRAHTYPVLGGLEMQFDMLFQRSTGCSQVEFVPFADEMQRATDIVPFD